VLRLVLDRSLLAFKSITLNEIKDKVKVNYPDMSLEVICTDENAEVPVMRIRVVKEAVEGGKVCLCLHTSFFVKEI